MKNLLIITAALSLSIVGCASPRRTFTPVPPPLLPGMPNQSVQKEGNGPIGRALSAMGNTIVGFFQPAADGPVIKSITYIPAEPGDPFGAAVFMSCNQAPNTRLRVQWSDTLPATAWLPVFDNECAPENQSWYVLFNGNFPVAYLRGENLPCNTAFTRSWRGLVLGDAKMDVWLAKKGGVKGKVRRVTSPLPEGVKAVWRAE